MILMCSVVTCFRTSKVGIKVTQNSVWCLERVGLVPKGTYDVGEALVVAAQNLVEGGRSKLFTFVYLCLADWFDG
jgi:sterol 24-C-methyltransferase